MMMQVYELSKKKNHPKSIVYFRSLGCYKEEEMKEAAERNNNQIDR